MFTRAFAAISEIVFFLFSSYFRWFRDEVSWFFPCCELCPWMRPHKWRAFFSSFLSPPPYTFGRPLFQLYYVNKILVQDSYVCPWFFLSSHTHTHKMFHLLPSHPRCRCHQPHTYNLYLCAHLFNCYHLWRFCRALLFVFVDLMLPSIYLIKTGRQRRCRRRRRRHVSCAFFCSVMLA